jgi:hypothetical protein
LDFGGGDFGVQRVEYASPSPTLLGSIKLTDNPTAQLDAGALRWMIPYSAIRRRGIEMKHILTDKTPFTTAVCDGGERINS